MIILTIIIFLCSFCTENPGDVKQEKNIDCKNKEELIQLLDRLNCYSNSGNYTGFMEEALPLYTQARLDGDERIQVILGSGIAHTYARMNAGDSVM